MTCSLSQVKVRQRHHQAGCTRLSGGLGGAEARVCSHGPAWGLETTGPGVVDRGVFPTTGDLSSLSHTVEGLFLSTLKLSLSLALKESLPRIVQGPEPPELCLAHPAHRSLWPRHTRWRRAHATSQASSIWLVLSAGSRRPHNCPRQALQEVAAQGTRHGVSARKDSIGLCEQACFLESPPPPAPVRLLSVPGCSKRHH